MSYVVHPMLVRAGKDTEHFVSFHEYPASLRIKRRLFLKDVGEVGR